MITLVTDSTAYLTKAEAEKLKIRLVPMHYILAGKSYAESYADENGDFVPQIAAHQETCVTAQASVADFVGIFQAIVHQGGEVLCLVISSRLSGAYSSACIAAKAVDAEKVRVVDSRTTAGGLALLLKRAAALIRQGYPLEDIVAPDQRATWKDRHSLFCRGYGRFAQKRKIEYCTPVCRVYSQYPTDSVLGKGRRRPDFRRNSAWP